MAIVPAARKSSPRRVHAVAALPLTFLVVLIACFPGARVPEVPPNGVLGLKGPLTNAEEAGPLKVVFASPKGKLTGPSEVTILFNKPVRSLELAGKEAPVPARIEPNIDGEWQWTGTRAAKFIPARAGGGGSFRLPSATSFKVTVPVGTKSLAGDALASDFSFSFETPRPEVASVTPYRDDHLEPDATFEIYLSQSVETAELQKHVTLSTTGKSVPIKLERVSNDNDKHYKVTPISPLALDTAFDLTVSEGLKGKEGPLPSLKASKTSFRTYGPLIVSAIACGSEDHAKKCSAPSGARIELSNAVKVRELKKAIAIEPAANLTWPAWQGDDEEVEYLNLNAHFLPGRSYTVRVKTPLADVHGQALKAGSEKRLEFGDVDPIARIGLTSGVLEASATREITVGHINTKDLEVAAVKLSEDDILAYADEHLDSAVLFARSGLPIKKVAAGRKNVIERHKVALDDVLGKKGSGAFALALRYTDGEDKHTDLTIAQLTDLAVSAKVSKQGSLVMVTRLADAAPVAGAEVRVRRKGEAAVTKTTDSHGLASFAPTEFKPSFNDEKAVIFVKSGDDVAFKEVSDNVSNWEFSPEDDGPIGLLFDDRGIYRPGETVHLKGIVREPVEKGLKTPSAGTSLRLELLGPSGETLSASQVSLTHFGTFSSDVRIPTTGRLGSYSARVMRGDEHVMSDDLEVAEFRPAEFKVAIESDKPSYVRGDTAKWTGRGDYLFGAPMNGAGADIAVDRTESYFQPDGTDGFDCDDRSYRQGLPDRSQRSSEVASSDVELDASGSTAASAKLEMPGQVGVERLTANLDVTDVTRQVISSSTTAIVHPAEHYVGIKLDERFVAEKTELKPSFIAVRPSGERVAGAPLRVSLIKRAWAVAKQGSGANVATTVATPVDTVVASCALSSLKNPVPCGLTPKEAGEYIVRVTSEDGRKNPVAASVAVYVTGESSSPLSLFRETDRADVELVADKQTYAVGDKAKVLVKSPWRGADALVTIERAGIFEKRTVKLTGAAPTIEVPIGEDMRPNVYVSVLVHKGRSKKAPSEADKPDVGAPGFRMGYTVLRIDPESKRLRVGVKPSKLDARPGDELSVALDVADLAGKGQKSELAVYAVDEGVLSLVNYQVPDPVKTFGEPRSLHVATLESRAGMATRFDPLSGLGVDKGLDGGGGDGPGGTSARKDFRASAFFNGAVVTDDAGHAEVKFKLPDGLTTYRIMAVAAGEDDRFGKGESHVTTSRPLMIRPALPRFLRAGDSFEASVVISSKAPSTQEVDVTAKIAGATIRGDSKKHVTVEPGKSVEVRFAADAPRAGSASFSFNATAGSESDAVVVERKIQVPAVMEAVALYGNTTAASAEKLGDLSAIRDDIGELTVTTASTALVGLDAGGTQLLEYPYGCTEQLTSKLVPLVAMKDLAADFHLPLPANTNDVVDKTIAKILTHQRYDGSFGFWPDSPKPSPWATTYALWGLSEAKKKGFKVPDDAIQSAQQYLFKALEGNEDGFRENVGPFVVYVLAESGKPDPGRVTLLFEGREKMPLYSKALLTQAMVLSKSDPAAIDTIVKELEASLRMDGALARTSENLGSAYAVYLDSETRTSAMVLRALLAAKPDHAMAAPLAMGLLKDRDGGAWRSTQEGAWALLALGDYRRAQEKIEPNFTAQLFFGDALVAEQPFSGRSVVPAVAAFPAGQLKKDSGGLLAFQVQGEGKLFYEARLRYARNVLPTDVLDRGFYVEKRFRKVTPETLKDALDTVPEKSLESFKAGDLVLADLVVVTPTPRTLVAIDDPLPAGFEAIDSRLATTSERLRGMEDVGPRQDDDDAAMERAEWDSYYTREVRDDRVLFFVDAMPAGVFRYRYLARATAMGKFVTPPTKAEEMYNPETFGRTGSAVIEVAPK